MQVSDNETMRVNVTLMQHSCLDGVVNIRDGGDGGEGEGRKRGAGVTVLDGGGGGSGKMAQDGDLINRVGFFNMTSSLSGGSGGFSFNSTRPLVTLELTSRNKTCRVNMQLRVVAMPAKSKSRGSESLVVEDEREIHQMF